jgi:hypothetical protein
VVGFWADLRLNQARPAVPSQHLRIPLSGHFVRLSNESVPLQNELLTLSWGNNGTSEWLQAQLQRPSLHAGFGVWHIEYGMTPLTPQQQTAQYANGWPVIDGGVLACGPFAAISATMAAADCEPPPEEAASICAAMRAFANPLPPALFSDEIYVQACAQSTTPAQLKDWMQSSVPAFAAELAASRNH